MRDDSRLLQAGKQKLHGWGVVRILFALFLVGSTGLLFGAYLKARGKRILLVPQKENVMVVAAHPDDAVIIAGAFCHETILKGGNVRIVFTTDGAAPEDAAKGAVRRREAYAAWALARVPRSGIRFLRNDDYSGLLDSESVSRAIARVADEMRAFHPDVVITSLYENGNYQHDVTNYIVARAISRVHEMPRIYEAPEYNFFLSLSRTPGKILQAISRLVPFYEYHAAPQFILDRDVHEFPLSRQDRELKMRMLRQFKSQDVEWLLDHFAQAERFHTLDGHNYCRPPFEYTGSMPYWLNQMKQIPIVAALVTKMFGRLQPVHPTVKNGTFSLQSIADCPAI